MKEYDRKMFAISFVMSRNLDFQGVRPLAYEFSLRTRIEFVKMLKNGKNFEIQSSFAGQFQGESEYKASYSSPSKIEEVRVSTKMPESTLQSSGAMILESGYNAVCFFQVP